jgi:pimeloyl-ACP methyl ester carboxylesterase
MSAEPEAGRSRQGVVQLGDGRTLTYTVHGVDDGPVVVLLDGAGARATAALAGPVAEGLGLTLIAPDRPGFRGSTPDPQPTIVGAAAAVAELVRSFSARPVGVLAQSLGAPFGMALAHGHPEVVHHLGLVGPIGPLDRRGATAGMDRPSRTVFGLARRAPFVLELLFRGMRRQVGRDVDRAADRFASLRSAEEQVIMRRDDVWPVLVEHFPELFAAPRSARVEFAMVARPWGFDVREIGVPVTIWAAGKDPVHPLGMAEDLAERIPQADLVVRPTSGAFCFLDEMEAILRAVAPGRGTAS